MIKQIYKIDNQFYCVVQIFQKSKTFTDNLLIESELNKFFLICQLLNEYTLINFENIICKCVMLKNTNEMNEYFLSKRTSLHEHS